MYIYILRNRTLKNNPYSSRLVNRDDNSSIFEVVFENSGGMIKNIEFSADAGWVLREQGVYSWRQGEQRDVKFVYTKSKTANIAKFVIDYEDMIGKKGSKIFEINLSGSVQHPGLKVKEKTEE